MPDILSDQKTPTPDTSEPAPAPPPVKRPPMLPPSFARTGKDRKLVF